MGKRYYLYSAVVLVTLIIAAAVDNCSEDRALVKCIQAGSDPKVCVCVIDNRCDK